ncbi:uncharacterized protein At4g02000-like [Primulina eburnea]|uniref:uncharacterized protein At4g02000-like n=1 Tax=Primulina eburnea TaxID=1245227 RepID=UPI003C6C6713
MFSVIFLTERQINLNIMKQCLSSIWRPGKGVTIREIGFKRFIFQFYHSVDLQRMLEGGPWTFDNNFFLLHHLKREEQPLQVPLRHLNFWIQIHDLSFGYMSEAVGRQLGSYMGNFLEYDSNNNKGSWRPYMRIRVAIDVQNPLKRCKKIEKSNGESFLVSFKYEKLGSFCFLCGCLGHIEKFCDKLFNMIHDDGKRNWGIWLRAQDKRTFTLGENKWLREDEPTGAPTTSGGTKIDGNQSEAKFSDPKVKLRMMINQHGDLRVSMAIHKGEEEGTRGG